MRPRSVSNLFLFSFIILFALAASSADAFEITSTPDESVAPFVKWEYNITSDTSWVGNITVTSTLGNDLILQDWNLSYLPTEDAVGLYKINITLQDTIAEVETYDYQNFTLEVTPLSGDETDWSIVTVTISLALGFGLLIVGIYSNNDFFLKFTSGVVWVFAGIFIYVDFSVGWMVISVCVGLYIMLVSAADWDKKRRQI